MKALDLQNIFHKELDVIYGKNEVDSFYFLCLEHFLKIPRIQLYLEPEFTIQKSELDVFFNTLEELKQQKPIQYVLGEAKFFGLKFKINNYVLIPRQETEELVDWIIKSVKTNSFKDDTINILDVGTGSGCIAITLAKYLPNVQVYALDISEKALEIAKQNAIFNDVNIEFINANILNRSSWDLHFEQLKFNIVVSNPPYVRHLEKTEIQSNVLDNEPHLALFVEDNNPLIFYKAITRFAVDKLTSNGQLYFEINQYLGNDTKQLLVDADFDDVVLRKDLNGNDRMLKGTKQ